VPQPSIIVASLAEIDRRLERVQAGLRPALEEEQPAAAPPASEREGGPAGRAGDLADAAGLVARLQDAVAIQERLITSTRELHAALERRLRATPPAAPAPGAAVPSAVPSALPSAVGVSAGPFADTAALRRFERALAALPEVGDVSLREYQGADRAVLEVQLIAPTP
jgi:hypothetical protein